MWQWLLCGLGFECVSCRVMSASHRENWLFFFSMATGILLQATSKSLISLSIVFNCITYSCICLSNRSLTPGLWVKEKKEVQRNNYSQADTLFAVNINVEHLEQQTVVLSFTVKSLPARNVKTTFQTRMLSHNQNVVTRNIVAVNMREYTNLVKTKMLFTHGSFHDHAAAFNVMDREWIWSRWK